jgi:hypothetical protein
MYDIYIVLSDEWRNLQDLELEFVMGIFNKRLEYLENERKIKEYNFQEERIWNQYIAYLPNMDNKTYKPYTKFFDQFKLKHPLNKVEIKEEIKALTLEQIEEKANRIRQMDLKRN